MKKPSAFLAILMFFLPFSFGCGQEKRTEEPKTGQSPIIAAKPETKKPADKTPTGTGLPVQGKFDYATIPADLFQVQDKTERTEEYKDLVKRMLSDLEDEVKWQDKLQSLKASSSRELKK